MTTNTSIQDIIADGGIASRAYLYKEFTRKFDMPLKIIVKPPKEVEFRSTLFVPENLITI